MADRRQRRIIVRIKGPGGHGPIRLAFTEKEADALLHDLCDSLERLAALKAEEAKTKVKIDLRAVGGQKVLRCREGNQETPRREFF